jgi:hypothetical protein
MRFLLHEQADEGIAIDLKAALCIGAIPGNAAGTTSTILFPYSGKDQILSVMFCRWISAGYETFHVPYNMLTAS